jgi:hypothetical protein
VIKFRDASLTPNLVTLVCNCYLVLEEFCLIYFIWRLILLYKRFKTTSWFKNNGESEIQFSITHHHLNAFFIFFITRCNANWTCTIMAKLDTWKSHYKKTHENEICYCVKHSLHTEYHIAVSSIMLFCLVMKRKFKQWWWIIPPISTKVAMLSLLRFSQFSGCWLILSVYILMSFDFPFVRLFEVR